MTHPYGANAHSRMAQLGRQLARSASDAEQRQNGPRRAWIAARRKVIVAETGMDSVEAWDRASAEWDAEAAR